MDNVCPGTSSPIYKMVRTKPLGVLKMQDQSGTLHIPTLKKVISTAPACNYMQLPFCRRFMKIHEGS